VNSVPSKNKLGIESIFRFTPDTIGITPDKPGVFAFFDASGEAMLIGSAKSVRLAVTDHWKGLEGPATCGAEYLGFEAHPQPLQIEAELIEKHREVFGRIPRRNIA
jgi:excinuclease UvrABC nuclease subunit